MAKKKTKTPRRRGIAIRLVAIDKVRPYERNPRNNDEAVASVARSIEAYGFRQPIVVDKNMVIIAGHTRYKAAQRLELDTVPVHVAKDLTPAQARAYRLADNRTAEDADWNLGQLVLELGEVKASELDLELTGFSGDELRAMLDPPPAEADEPQIPPPPNQPRSKTGKVYQLGAHRLAVGDATDPAVLQRLMLGGSASLFLTDPPTKRPRGNAKPGQEDPVTLIGAALSAAYEVMAPGAAWYLWHEALSAPIIHSACETAGWKPRLGIVWIKNKKDPGGQDYATRHDNALYGWKAGASRVWNPLAKQTSVIELDRPPGSSDDARAKPLKLYETLILNSTRAHDIVLDTFAGSGTALIAAETLDRVCRVCESDPRRADVIRRRWADLVHGDGCNWEGLTPEAGVTDG